MVCTLQLALTPPPCPPAADHRPLQGPGGVERAFSSVTIPSMNCIHLMGPQAAVPASGAEKRELSWVSSSVCQPGSAGNPKLGLVLVVKPHWQAERCLHQGPWQHRGAGRPALGKSRCGQSLAAGSQAWQGQGVQLTACLPLLSLEWGLGDKLACVGA